LYGRYFFYLRFLITPFDHCMVGTSFIYGLWLHLLTIVWLVLLLLTVSDYTFWPLHGRYFFYLWFLITPFDHCMVEASFIYGFSLHLLTILLSVLLLFTFLITLFDCCMVEASFIYGFWLHFWPLYGRYFFYLRFLITPFDHFMVGTSFIYVSNYTFWPLYGRYFFYLRCLITNVDHCVVGTSFIYDFWLHLLTIVWLILLLFTVSSYIF
jgi:hypothetical protein